MVAEHAMTSGLDIVIGGRNPAKITYGNRSNRHLRGLKLALRPAVVKQHGAVPIAWVCGNASVPQRMEILGTNTTTLPLTQLPVDCR